MDNENIFHLLIFISDTNNHILENVFQIIYFSENKRTEYINSLTIH